MADRDELGLALANTWNKRLAGQGFWRVGRHNLKNVCNGIVRLFNFQISGWGSREFCVNVAAFTLCGNDSPVLEPGFRLRNSKGGDMWLPSRTAEDAARSVETAWNAAEEQAMPWLRRNSTLEGHLQVLQSETSGSHHSHFQIGIVEAMLGLRKEAMDDLAAASRLYAEDGRVWCSAYIVKVETLMEALKRGDENALLEQWRTANLGVHRIRQA